MGTDRRTETEEVDVVAVGPTHEGGLPPGAPVRQGPLGATQVDPPTGDQGAHRVPASALARGWIRSSSATYLAATSLEMRSTKAKA